MCNQRGMRGILSTRKGIWDVPKTFRQANWQILRYSPSNDCGLFMRCQGAYLEKRAILRSGVYCDRLTADTKLTLATVM